LSFRFEAAALWNPLRRRALAVGLGACLGLAWAALAQAQQAAMAPPQEPVVLTVSGMIGRTNAEGEARFSRAMLEALGQTTIRTTTPWTEGETVFAGPLVRDLLASLEAEGRSVHAIASNDYAVDIPIEDVLRYPVIIALSINGQTLTTRTRGPLWVIYPWSDYEELRNELIHARSIWQLKALVVE